MSKCEYIPKCELYATDSVTCNKDGGGPYCGRWRSYATTTFKVKR